MIVLISNILLYRYAQLTTLPEKVIIETTEYKCLQSQFSVLYNESMQIKTQLDEARGLLASSRNTHLRQIEQMEVIPRLQKGKSMSYF